MARPTRALGWSIFAAFALASALARPARADDPQPSSISAPAPASTAAPAAPAPRDPARIASSPSFFDAITAGSDLIATVPYIASFDGSWSISLQALTFLTNRTWAGPFPRAVLANEATRVVYGTSWSLMLGAESLAAVLASGGRYDWIGAATWRTDWLLGGSVPSGCESIGARGGCGLGVGGFGGLLVKLAHAPLVLQVSGGWIQQRVETDARRTLAESTWVLTPMQVGYEFRVGGPRVHSPVALDIIAGPGIYGGMHVVHLNPREGHEAEFSGIPWHEMVPLEGGAGLGAEADGRLTFAEHVVLEGGIVFAPMEPGAIDAHPTPLIAPLDTPRSGTPTWRRVSFGVAIDHPSLGARVGLMYWAAELSTRPVTSFGHQAVGIRFDFPLRVDLLGAHRD